VSSAGTNLDLINPCQLKPAAYYLLYLEDVSLFGLWGSDFEECLLTSYLYIAFPPLLLSTIYLHLTSVVASFGL
jgi:hypothetical protein